jgi:hypothetical protein
MGPLYLKYCYSHNRSHATGETIYNSYCHGNDRMPAGWLYGNGGKKA